MRTDPPSAGTARSRRRRGARTLAAVAALAGLVVLSGPAAGDDVAIGDAEAGREQFAASCAACHGDDATGRGATPGIHDAVTRLGLTEVRATIENGRGGMPAFGGTLDESEIDDVVAYLEERSGDTDAGTDGRHGMGPGQMPMLSGVGLTVLVVGVLVIVALLAAVVIAVVRRNTDESVGPPPSGPPADPPTSPPQPEGSARDLLDQRYARGEIERDAYLQARRDLGDPAD